MGFYEVLDYGHIEMIKYLISQGVGNKHIPKYIKYEVLQESKIGLLIFMHNVKGNTYLKMEVLKRIFPSFTEYEILSILS